MQIAVLPIVLMVGCVAGLAVALLVMGQLFNPRRSTPVKQMPYESGVDPIHDTRRRFDVRFHLLAVAFLVFDVELLLLYPWAVASRAVGPPEGEPAEGVARGIDAAVAAGWIESRDLVFAGAMVFIALLALGLVYDWRKGILRWR
jgi:NADH-quinone oxidoreductase subunit A